MRILVIASALAALALPATAASAQWGGRYDRGYDYRNSSETAREIRECRRELRRADSRREYHRERRECRREIADARRDDARRHGYGHYGRGYSRPPYGHAWGYRNRNWRYRR